MRFVRYGSLMKVYSLGLLLAVCVAELGCGDNAQPSTGPGPDAGPLPSCADLSCVGIGLCTVAGVCSCTIDGASESCQAPPRPSFHHDAGVDAP